jgi:hypothetical protein
MNILIQRHLFKRTTFEIRNNFLHFHSKGIANSIEYDILYEEISDKVIYETKMEDFPKVTTVIVVIGLIIGIAKKDTEAITFASTLLLLVLWILFATRKRTASIVLYDNRVLIINLKKPNPEEVKRFVDNLQLKIKEFLKSKYGTIDRDLPLDPQLNNYTWLKNRNIIDDAEFNDLKNKLLRLESDNKIGFN